MHGKRRRNRDELLRITDEQLNKPEDVKYKILEALI